MPSGTHDRRMIEEYSRAYLEYYPVICSAITARIRDRDEADDLCQEIFLIFFDKFDTVQNRRQWLYGTMKNVLLNHYRKKKLPIPAGDDIDDAGPGFTNGFRDTRIVIQEAMDRIECDEEDRIILDLVATYRYTYASAGRATGISRRKVEYRYGILVRKIQDYLSHKGIHNIGDLL